MNFWKKHATFTALLLAVALLCGCSIQRPAAPKTDAESSSADYEQYSEASLKQQEAFDQFTEDLFKKEVAQSTIDLHFNLADPQAYGITETPITFGDFSLDSIKQDFQELRQLKTDLNEFEFRQLRKEQQLTYRILSSYIDTELSCEGLELYSQPLTPTIGIQAQLPVLLAEYPFYDKQDVENYLALLEQIDVYYGQIMEFEKAVSQAGLFMSDDMADHVLESCEAYMIQPDHSFMSETFDSRLEALADLSEEEKADYKARNLQVLNEHFVPAYQILVDGLTALKGTGVNDKGLCYLPEGKRYYEYLVESTTGTSYSSVPKLKEAIENQIDSDLLSMARIMQDNPEVLDQVEDYEFKVAEPSAILENLKEQISRDFPPLPPCNYTVKYVPEALEHSLSPAFYLVPPMDRYQDNVIYINGAEEFKDQDLYTTLAHEGYPGHLYQSVYFISKNDCDLRQIMSFGSYSEGWATYVENYSYTLDNGLDPALGRLLSYNSAVSLGLHAYLDICVNYDGWTKEQVGEYLGQYFDIQGTDVVDSMYSMLVENPTNYLEYYVGCLEISNMRDTAAKALGESFHLKDFHTFILDIGPAPFTVIKTYFRTWLKESKEA